jgi:periplasmic protein TonB
MIYFDVLPAATLQSFLVAPPPPPPPPPPPAQTQQPKVVKVIPRQFDAGKLMAPKTIPKEIAQIKEDELPPPLDRRRRSRRRGRRHGRRVGGWRA